MNGKNVERNIVMVVVKFIGIRGEKTAGRYQNEAPDYNITIKKLPACCAGSLYRFIYISSDCFGQGMGAAFIYFFQVLHEWLKIAKHGFCA
jgi:hypothetical protein